MAHDEHTKRYIINQYRLAVLAFETAKNDEEQWAARREMARDDRLAFELFGKEFAEEAREKAGLNALQAALRAAEKGVQGG